MVGLDIHVLSYLQVVYILHALRYPWERLAVLLSVTWFGCPESFDIAHGVVRLNRDHWTFRKVTILKKKKIRVRITSRPASSRVGLPQ